jgi:alkylhydroperoxidase/carboxymuconolactone decarboxylase family protein YurZ
MGETDNARLAEALAEARARRGYLLPHHGLFVLLSPDFAARYEEAYGRLALEPVSLPAEDKEFVWLVIVALVGSGTARHHVRRFREAGGGLQGIEAALRLTAFAIGRDRFDFAAEAWARHLPGWDADAAEDAAIEALLRDTGLPLRRAALGLLAAATARRDAPGFARALRRCHAAGIAERDMAEAMCLTVQPAGLPNVVRAAGQWRRMIAAGEVPASEPFRLWAAMEAEGDAG